MSNSIEEINKKYSGKTMSEIMDIEEKEFESKQPEIDKKHKDDCCDRTRMLTVQKLIDYLKTQNPNACIVAYEMNSEAYIEQLPDLPNACICTVKEDKEKQIEYLKHWYKDIKNTEEKINHSIERDYRYVNDDDIVIRL